MLLLLPWLLCLALLIAAAVLWVKVRLLQQAFEDIADGLTEKLEEDTNTLISLSTRDAHARRLASQLNQQLRLLRAQRQRFQNGDRELKESVTNISHDLRTPLTAIRGYLDLMEREDLTPEARRYLTLIRDRAEAMTRLAEELFRYSIVQSAAEWNPVPLDLRAALEEAVAGFYGALTARGIQPQIQLPDTPVLRTLDPSALARVLSNLLSNALKYSAGDLKISLEETGEIRFANTAPGLDEVAVGRLFHRFFTVETGQDSTGLGLAIAKTLVEQMGGSIGAEYSAGRLTIRVQF